MMGTKGILEEQGNSWTNPDGLNSYLQYQQLP